MPDALLPNPTGAGYFNAVVNGAHDEQYVVDPDVEGNLPIGTLVEIEAYSGPGADNPPDVPMVQPSSTTADFLLLGPVVGGQTTDDGNGTSIAPGGVATVRRIGLCQILCDATTALDDVLIQSTATAGAAKPAGSNTPVLGKTIGVALEAVTISSGTALVWAMIGKI